MIFGQEFITATDTEIGTDGYMYILAHDEPKLQLIDLLIQRITESVLKVRTGILDALYIC